MSPLLLKIEEASPVEPRGWFRWLHDSFASHYFFDDCRLVKTLTDQGWLELEQNFDGIWATDAERIAHLVGVHSWTVGGLGLIKIAEACWRQLNPEQRGSFMAGLSETWRAPDSFAWIKLHLNGVCYLPESSCQLACNAIRYMDAEMIESIFSLDQDWNATVRRGDAGAYPDTNWPIMLELVSHRLIDMIFEAAVIAGDIPTVRAAVAKGADPNILMWRLERSYNEVHSPLSFCVSEGRRAMVEALLEAGADPAGNQYTQCNYPLYLGVARRDEGVIDILLGHGASFRSKSRELQIDDMAWGSEAEIIAPRRETLGQSSTDIAWAVNSVGRVIPLAEISSKVIFHEGDGQGGHQSTFLGKLLFDDRIGELIKYEALGMDTRLSAEELLRAINCDSVRCLQHLLRNYTDDQQARVMFRVRRRKPDFGADRREIEALPQANERNRARDFDPGGKFVVQLEDKSKLFADLEAIAPPGHSHGPCLEGHFWLRVSKAVFRRREDQVVVIRMSHRWAMTPWPTVSRKVSCSVPCIKEVDGSFIDLGITWGDLRDRVRDVKIRDLLEQLRENEHFLSLFQEALNRMKRQDATNLRPPAPRLSEDELEG